jgi:hypothetical protein
MNFKAPIVILAVALIFLTPAPLDAHGKKKNQPERAMLEKMDAVPCGAKQKGLSGLGSFWASVGITNLHSNETLCPQYLLRTDEMDYRIRPMDLKHPEVLPVGQEIVFKIKKDRMLLKVPDGDKKLRAYEVVAMEPTSPGNQNTSMRTSPNSQ